MGATIFSRSWGGQPGEDRPFYPDAVFVALGRNRPPPSTKWFLRQSLTQCSGGPQPHSECWDDRACTTMTTGGMLGKAELRGMDAQAARRLTWGGPSPHAHL